MKDKIPDLLGRRITVFAFLLVISAALQWQSGAWKSDFGAHADEASHVVTSLMLRDYLFGGFLEELHPKRYAEVYYETFPKVAIGHYPPGFYLLAGILLIPARSPEAMLFFMVLLSAGAGWMTWLLGRRLLQGNLNALLIAVLFCILPLVRTYTAIVMSDLLLVIFILAASYSFLCFLETGKTRFSLGFGFLAALAILTKGSGLCLALVPPVSIMITGKWAFLRNWRLWVAPIPVLLLAFPWMWFTREITAEGMSRIGMLEFFKSAVPFYGMAVGKEIGWGISGILWVSGLFGVGGYLFRFSDRKSRPISPDVAVAWAVVISVVTLAVTVPAGLDHRYLLPLIPVSLLLAAHCIEKQVGGRSTFWLIWAVPVLVIVVLLETWRTVEKRYTGATSAITSVIRDNTKRSKTGKTRVLVISNPGGEGALTAAAAFLSPDSLEIRRGSRLLAKSDWLGRDYEIAFKTREDLERLLKASAIDFVVFDHPVTSGAFVAKHWASIIEIFDASNETAKWDLVSQHSSHRKHGVESAFSVYRSQPEAAKASD